MHTCKQKHASDCQLILQYADWYVTLLLCILKDNFMISLEKKQKALVKIHEVHLVLTSLVRKTFPN